MSLQTWRRANRWLRVAFWGASAVALVQLVRGVDRSHDTSYVVYLAIMSLFALSDVALRVAERRASGSSTEVSEHT